MKKTFHVALIGTVSHSIQVQAESLEDACDESWWHDAPGGLCHQCSRDYDLGDLDETMIYDEDWNLLLDDTTDALLRGQIKALREENKKLRAQLSEASKP